MIHCMRSSHRIFHNLKRTWFNTVNAPGPIAIQQNHHERRHASSDSSTKGSNHREKIECMRGIIQQPTQNGIDPHDNSWDTLWQKEITPWDIGQPTPILISELERIRKKSSPMSVHKSFVSHPPNAKKRIRSLVPGCGAGYDLATIARYHDDYSSSLSSSSHSQNINKQTFLEESTVIGLDVSSTSLLKAKETVNSLLKKEKNEKLSTLKMKKSHDVVPTNIKFMHGDFFQKESSWKEATSPLSFVSSDDRNENDQNRKLSEECMKFDFILDYTFFCAIQPELRPQWGKRLSMLLIPETGRLLTIMFPVPSSSSSPPSILEGPPYPVIVEDYKNTLEPHGFQMLDGCPYEHEDTIGPRRGNEFVSWWKLIV